MYYMSTLVRNERIIFVDMASHPQALRTTASSTQYTSQYQVCVLHGKPKPIYTVHRDNEPEHPTTRHTAFDRYVPSQNLLLGIYPHHTYRSGTGCIIGSWARRRIDCILHRFLQDNPSSASNLCRAGKPVHSKYLESIFKILFSTTKMFKTVKINK